MLAKLSVVTAPKITISTKIPLLKRNKPQQNWKTLTAGIKNRRNLTLLRFLANKWVNRFSWSSFSSANCRCRWTAAAGRWFLCPVITRWRWWNVRRSASSLCLWCVGVSLCIKSYSFWRASCQLSKQLHTTCLNKSNKTTKLSMIFFRRSFLSKVSMYNDVSAALR